ncbi:MAG TPA: N-acetylmuramoyl-L-alanine amidase-like domain-containing protein [Blastocatellia bacterium]|nr:N-acetylmuramoyl-L-alanine amidase-like domain-containing protein [Blastocatellia bacterium]
MLSEVRFERNVATRIERISSRFLGRPYLEHPLDPEPPNQEPHVESLVVSLEGFDCVTYIETVLALALAETSDEFLFNLRAIRYEDGVVAWEKRNHYMVDWARNNVERRVLVDMNDAGPVEKTRDLGVIERLPQRRVTFRCFPKQSVADLPFITTGDLIMFVSTKKNLDVFHTGFIVEAESDLVLRHATRQKGAVVEESLSEFLGSQRMSGTMVFKPSKGTI